MGKSSRQTFKKRQRELAKKQKREDKAKRLAVRRSGPTAENDPEEEGQEPEEEFRRGGLVIRVRSGKSSNYGES